jgi:hypothetical protein
LSMEHFSKYAPITRKCPNTALTRCKQLQVIALVLFCGCGMWDERFHLFINDLRRRGFKPFEFIPEGSMCGVWGWAQLVRAAPPDTHRGDQG